VDEWADPDRRDAALERVRAQVKHGPWLGPKTRDYRSLQPSELRALEAMSHGLSMLEASEVTGFNYETLRASLKNVRRVLGAKNTTHACCEALRQGLIR
jgi:DNA-binding CsgD family transcriptional regulator